MVLRLGLAQSMVECILLWTKLGGSLIREDLCIAVRIARLPMELGLVSIQPSTLALDVRQLLQRLLIIRHVVHLGPWKCRQAGI